MKDETISIKDAFTCKHLLPCGLRGLRRGEVRHRQLPFEVSDLFVLRVDLVGAELVEDALILRGGRGQDVTERVVDRVPIRTRLGCDRVLEVGGRLSVVAATLRELRGDAGESRRVRGLRREGTLHIGDLVGVGGLHRGHRAVASGDLRRVERGLDRGQLPGGRRLIEARLNAVVGVRREKPRISTAPAVSAEAVAEAAEHRGEQEQDDQRVEVAPKPAEATETAAVGHTVAVATAHRGNGHHHPGTAFIFECHCWYFLSLCIYLHRPSARLKAE